MLSKFFPLDKNYILKEAQAAHREALIAFLVEKALATYQIRFNPLGLEDDTVRKIKSFKLSNFEPFDNFYSALCGIYRYKFGETQLELLFDGRSHFEKYGDDWKMCFQDWITEFCQRKSFLKTVLAMTVFLPDEDKKVYMTENRMKAFISNYFEVKLQKKKGEPVFKIA